MYKNKKVVIMGLGLNEGGVGAVKFFLREGADVLATDLKSRKELAPSLKKLVKFRRECRGRLRYSLGSHKKSDFKNADLIIQGPGVPNNSPYLTAARKNNVAVDTDVGIFFEMCRAPIIGITGSKGKSTTAALLAHILKQKFKDVILAGNIGKSPLDYLESISPKSMVVLELSSWQLEGLSRHKKSPHIAVITNIFKEHLNRYRGFADYIRAKSLIFKYQKKGDFSVASPAVFKLTGVYLKAPNFQRILLRFNLNSELLRLNLNNLHPENIRAAVAVAKICKIPLSLIKKGIRTFKGLPGRQELIASVNGVKYYNDTTATMPDAAILALKTLEKSSRNGKIILIAGGTDKKLDFKEFVTEIMKRVGVLILLPGDATEKLKLGIKNYELRIKKEKLRMFEVSSMREAVHAAYKNASRGDIALLSPGAASFGLFQNEFDRGKEFVKEVMKLKNIKSYQTKRKTKSKKHKITA